MLGSFIMRGVKLGVRWCSCSDTISIQRYHSLSLSLSKSCRRWRAINTRWYMYCVCLYLHCLPVAGSRPIFQLANICLTNTQTCNETQFLIICSVVVISLVLPLLSFVAFCLWSLFCLPQLEKLDFWASRCEAAVLFYTLSNCIYKGYSVETH